MVLELDAYTKNPLEIFLLQKELFYCVYVKDKKKEYFIFKICMADYFFFFLEAIKVQSYTFSLQVNILDKYREF